jgi:hypothetical protein
MNSDDRKLLHSIDRRLAGVEERVKDVPKISEQLANLRVKVGVISAGIAAFISLISHLLK